MEIAPIISVSAVVIATASVLINYWLFRHVKDPCIVVFATPDDRRPSIIN